MDLSIAMLVITRGYLAPSFLSAQGSALDLRRRLAQFIARVARLPIRSSAESAVGSGGRCRGIPWDPHNLHQFIHQITRSPHKSCLNHLKSSEIPVILIIFVSFSCLRPLFWYHPRSLHRDGASTGAIAPREDQRFDGAVDLRQRHLQRHLLAVTVS